jgi:lactate permease
VGPDGRSVSTLLALLPLLLVLGLLASGRAGTLTAGISGLAATLAVSVALLLPAGGLGAVADLWRREIPAGGWLAWQVIAIIASGMFFHRCTLARPPPAPARRIKRRRGGCGRSAFSSHPSPRR